MKDARAFNLPGRSEVRSWDVVGAIILVVVTQLFSHEVVNCRQPWATGCPITMRRLPTSGARRCQWTRFSQRNQYFTWHRMSAA